MPTPPDPTTVAHETGTSICDFCDQQETPTSRHTAAYWSPGIPGLTAVGLELDTGRLSQIHTIGVQLMVAVLQRPDWWVACPSCADLVDRRDPAALAAHVIPRQFQGDPNPPSPREQAALVASFASAYTHLLRVLGPRQEAP